MVTSRPVASALGALVLLAIFVPGCAISPPSDTITLAQGPISREPATAAAFFSAYLHGDEGAAERAASPLYEQEWARRNISFENRMSWFPMVRAGSTGPDWLDVSFASGVADDGHGHLLYIGRSTRSGQSPAASVWRLDTDLSGRVIWAELVWLFSYPTGPLTTVSDPTAGDSANIPPVFARMHPQAVYGIRATNGWEGYYAVRHMAGAKSVVNFFGVDEYGELRVGVWTYPQT